MSGERFLGGCVVAHQPKTGFRAGLDAVMLAASVPGHRGDRALELGSGAGTASLCLAARVTEISVTGVEIDSALVRLARRNARANDFTRVTFATGDVLDMPAELRQSFDHVFCNPPFHAGAAPRSVARARALMDSGRLGDWLGAALRRTRPGGSFTCILSAARMGEALRVLPERGTRAFPLWPHAGKPAGRVILQTRKGSRSPFMVLPGLVLHAADGSYTAEADAVLRDGGSLALDSPRL